MTSGVVFEEAIPNGRFGFVIPSDQRALLPAVRNERSVGSLADELSALVVVRHGVKSKRFLLLFLGDLLLLR